MFTKIWWNMCQLKWYSLRCHRRSWPLPKRIHIYWVTAFCIDPSALKMTRKEIGINENCNRLVVQWRTINGSVCFRNSIAVNLISPSTICERMQKCTAIAAYFVVYWPTPVAWQTTEPHLSHSISHAHEINAVELFEYNVIKFLQKILKFKYLQCSMNQLDNRVACHFFSMQCANDFISLLML